MANSSDEFFGTSTTAHQNAEEDWLKTKAEEMTPEEVLNMWGEKIGNKEFLLLFIRLYHESVRLHGDAGGNRQVQQRQQRDKERGTQPQQNMTLADILNAMSKQ